MARASVGTRNCASADRRRNRRGERPHQRQRRRWYARGPRLRPRRMSAGLHREWATASSFLPFVAFGVAGGGPNEPPPVAIGATDDAQKSSPADGQGRPSGLSWVVAPPPVLTHR